MSLLELGALGEFLGSFAVMATLVYLAVQTSQTRRVAAGEAARSIVKDFQDLWASIAVEDDYTRLVRTACNDWNALNHNEQARVNALFANLVLHLDGAIRQEHLAEVRQWIPFWEDNLLGLLRCPGGAEWWANIQYIFHSDLRERVNSRLDDSSSITSSWIEGLSWWRLDAADAGHGAGPSLGS